MIYAMFYSWPPGPDRSQKAKEFYDKAIQHLAAFPPGHDIAVCLCGKSGANRCFIYVGGPGDANELSGRVRMFLAQAGCHVDSREEGENIPNLCVDTLWWNFAMSGMTVFAGMARVGGKVRDLTP